MRAYVVPSPLEFDMPQYIGNFCGYGSREDQQYQAGHDSSSEYGSDHSHDDDRHQQQQGEEESDMEVDEYTDASASREGTCVLESVNSTSSVMESRPKFVAGQNFFNYERFGCLRNGPVIDLLSIRGCGLALAVCVCAFLYTSIHREAQWMFDKWNWTGPQRKAATRLIEIPGTLCFVVGLINDSFPIMNSYRKSYMVLGFVISFVCLCALFTATRVEGTDHVRQNHQFFITVLFAGATTGTFVTLLASHTMIIEWSQREAVHERGKIQATYLILRASSRAMGSVFAHCLVQDDQSRLVFVEASYMCLAVLTLVAIVAVIVFIDEEDDEKYFRETFEQKLVWCWKVAQQKAIWRTIWFIWCFGFFIYIRFPRPHYDILRLNKMVIPTNSTQPTVEIESTATLMQNLAQQFVAVMTFLLWRVYFRNASWRQVFALVPIMQVVPTFVMSVCTIYVPLLRSQVLYIMFTSMTGVTMGLMEMMTIVPVTEIVQEGIEASTVGMILMADHTVRLFDVTLMELVSQGLKTDVIPEKTYTPSTLMIAITANVLINALSAIGLHFLPLQKIDAQYLRVYGGFTKAAGYFIFGAFTVLFCFCIATNLASLMKSFP